jgi:hypothetical protein
MFAPVILWLIRNTAAFQGEIRNWCGWWIRMVILCSPIVFWAELRSVFLGPLVIVTFAATVVESGVLTPHETAVGPLSSEGGIFGRS